MSQRESSELNALVDCYIAVWHEPDAERRRKRIAELWVEDGVQFTRSREMRGYQALEERVEAAHEEFVQTGGFVFRLSSDAQGHHNALKFNWEMVPAGGSNWHHLPSSERRRAHLLRLPVLTASADDDAPYRRQPGGRSSRWQKYDLPGEGFL